MTARNLMMPGNPRYQPESLRPIFGYDNLYQPAIAVEMAVMWVLGEIGIIPDEDIKLLTPDVEARLLDITTTEVDKIEREVTKHDVRALVRLMQEILPEPLRRWAHVPLTSYDVLDTARALQFVRAHREVVFPKGEMMIRCLAERVVEYADTIQIGRTHGQHALPITVGFWLATILNRLASTFRETDRFANGLVGKVSGAVGAYNAQVGLGMYRIADDTFESQVLRRLGLNPAPISTQIVPPEPLVFYLFSCVTMSAALGQLGRDCRHLMRSEIGEIGEPFAKGQVGSSTMAHKRNPITFENTEGMYLRSKNMFGNVFDTLISEHQRDLVGSSLLRDLPAIVVNLVVQLEALLKPDKKGVPFIRRIVVDNAALLKNIVAAGDKILAEPLYIALQMAGYAGDAHELVNHTIMPLTGRMSLSEAVEYQAAEDVHLDEAWERVPEKLKALLSEPTTYRGKAAEKAKSIASTVLGASKGR